MDRDTQHPQRVGLAILGYAILMLGLPLAVWGMVIAPNEYEATLGVDAVDCDGPLGVALVALPALLLYAAGTAVHARRSRRLPNLAAALICLAICATLAVNLGRALVESVRQEAACEDGGARAPQPTFQP